MSITKPRILVIEDEPAQVELLTYNLRKQGYEVLVAKDGETGFERARDEMPDLILLDWMLPKMTGVEVCRKLRRTKSTKQTPVIMLTARSEESDKIQGLDTGADDYLTKPYSVKELLARIRASLRRPNAASSEGRLEVGPVVADLTTHVVLLDGKSMHLGPTEFRLLTTLMQSPERVYSRDQLLDLVWGISADVDTRTVDVHIGRLRRVFGDPKKHNLIRTVRGYGYSFQAG